MCVSFLSFCLVALRPCSFVSFFSPTYRGATYPCPSFVSTPPSSLSPSFLTLPRSLPTARPTRPWCHVTSAPSRPNPSNHSVISLRFSVEFPLCHYRCRYRTSVHPRFPLPISLFVIAFTSPHPCPPVPFRLIFFPLPPLCRVSSYLPVLPSPRILVSH
ncbi:hypothetical protein DFH07DRAFT_823195 [Mycena maculata]|uniref:Secreted protein n=1 Tax=Mycena maculata TaxID=230809 RepID=A0AAD7J0P2_9AGAR|nr:hypothetical protein DFH07DRAFT_823195 [Mycena maculata]